MGSGAQTPLFARRTMKTKIRRGVFETNSSSCHSISIASGGEVDDKLYVDEHGVCEIHPGEFGWGIDIHRDAATKAAYALTWAMSCEGYGVGKKDEALALLTEVVKQATGCARVEFVPDEWASG